jgi:hypothetical protein
MTVFVRVDSKTALLHLADNLFAFIIQNANPISTGCRFFQSIASPERTLLHGLDQWRCT